MIKIETDAVHDGCHHDEAKTVIELTGLNSDCCKPVKPLKPCRPVCDSFKVASVRTSKTPATGTTVVVPTEENTTTVQVFNNNSQLASLTVDARPLSAHAKGNLVLETLCGITLLNVVGAYGLSGSELAQPGSTLSLKWNGSQWVIAA